MGKGTKINTVVNVLGILQLHYMTPANVHDKKAFEVLVEMIKKISKTEYVCGDTAYQSTDMKESLAEKDIVLIAPKRLTAKDQSQPEIFKPIYSIRHTV